MLLSSKDGEESALEGIYSTFQVIFLLTYLKLNKNICFIRILNLYVRLRFYTEAMLIAEVYFKIKIVTIFYEP